jgi:hypothetical protein
MSSKQVVMKDGDGWGLFQREWDGIDKPDYIFIRCINFSEAVDLVQSGVTDLFGHVEEALRNPLDELGKLADKDGSSGV